MMKKIGTLIVIIAIITFGHSQVISADAQTTENQGTKVNKDESTKVEIGNNLLSVEKNDSVSDIKVGDNELSILESMQGHKYRFRKHSDDDENPDYRYFDKRRNRFRGHWAGIELGLNNYVTSDRSMVLPDDIDYMTLHSGKSTNFNINFTQLSLGITRHIGFVTGLGLNWNNYRFDGNNNITKGANGVIEELDPGTNLKKSKLATLFMTFPFMLEMQLRINHNNLSLAAGPICAIKLSSHTKMVLEDGDKIKSNGDFSLNMLRYGFTGRVGYGNFQLYGTYYKTPLFASGKGPGGVSLYPFEIGIALTFND